RRSGSGPACASSSNTSARRTFRTDGRAEGDERMGHSIRGFAAGPETLQEIRARFPAAKLVGLDAGFALVPGTDALIAEIDAADPTGEGVARGTHLLFASPAILRLP